MLSSPYYAKEKPHTRFDLLTANNIFFPGPLLFQNFKPQGLSHIIKRELYNLIPGEKQTKILATFFLLFYQELNFISES